MSINQPPDSTDALETDLRTATRFRSLSTLNIGLAHDLRGALNNIVVNLELLKQAMHKGGGDVGQPQHYAVLIQQEVSRLNGYIQVLLNLTAPAKDSPGQLDLCTALTETMGLIRAQAKLQRVNMDMQLPERTIRITCRQVDLRQALLNIIINALEAMPEGGTLTVRITPRDTELGIEICDTGAGIPESLRERVFDMHYTTKDTGTGIGLYVARSVIHQHGGSIQIQNNFDAGTCFGITLPLAHVNAAME